MKGQEQVEGEYEKMQRLMSNVSLYDANQKQTAMTYNNFYKVEDMKKNLTRDQKQTIKNMANRNEQKELVEYVELLIQHALQKQTAETLINRVKL